MDKRLPKSRLTLAGSEPAFAILASGELKVRIDLEGYAAGVVNLQMIEQYCVHPSDLHVDRIEPGTLRFRLVPSRTHSSGNGAVRLLGDPPIQIALTTLDWHDLPVKIVLFDNHSLGMVQLEMEVTGPSHQGCEPKRPCFAARAVSACLARRGCQIIGIRFGRMDILKRILKSGRTGFYFAVTTEGEVGAGDPIKPIARADEGLTVSDVVNLYTVDAENQELLRLRDPVGHPPRELARLLPQAALGSDA